MENQGQPSGSKFAPRLRMSTRWKAANGSIRKATNRFRSKRMNQIAKNMKKRQAYMPPNKWNRNNRRGIGVANNAHMHGPLENTRHSPISRLRDGPLVDIKLSDPSRAKDVLPSVSLENPSPFLPKDGSTARLQHQMQSHFTEIGEAHNLDIARGSHPISSKATIKSAHTTKHTDASNNDGDTLVLKSKDPSGRTQGQHINVRKSTNKISKPLNCNGVLKGSNISLASEHLVPNKYDSNEYTTTQGEVMEVEEKERETCICEAHARYEGNRKQEEIKKANRAPNSSSFVNFDKLIEELVPEVEEISSNLFVKNLSRYQEHKASCNEDKSCAIVSSKDVVRSKLESHKDQPARNVGKVNYVNSKRKMESLLAKKFGTCGGDDSTSVVQWDNLPLMTVKRRCIPSNEEDEDEASGYNTNLMGVDGTIGLTSHTVISTDCIERQCGYCSKPIDKPTWSGIFKINGKKCVSLVGHLSTKSCEKVWNLSKSLPPMVEVEKVPRSIVWTKIWKASKPTCDNIGLYFLHHNMRYDEELDQLVNEVKESDLVLRAVVNEAEMLIFPSVLLPERYQTFQAKHYLWAVFKPREDKGVYSQNN